MTTNWKAIQVPKDKDDKNKPNIPHGVKPRYMSMGSYHADLSKEGKSRKIFKGKDGSSLAKKT